MRLSQCRMRPAPSIFVVVLLLFAGVLPSKGADPGADPPGPASPGQSQKPDYAAPPAKARAGREIERARKEEQERAARERAAAGEEQDRRKKARTAPKAKSPAEPQALAAPASPGQIRGLAYKAALYAYPLVLADAARRADARAARRAGGVDLFRQFFHSDTVPGGKRPSVVLPRADILYSLAWLELKNSPYLLEIPAMPDRRHLIQLLDAWTRNLPALSARDTGGKNGKYIVLMQGQQVPAEYAAEYAPIYCPTSLCMLLAHFPAANPEDLSAAREAQQGLRLVPLFPERLAEQTESADADPMQQLAALDAEDFFSSFTDLLADNPAADRDLRMTGELSRLGIQKGQKIFFTLDEPLRRAAAAGCRQALADMGVYYNIMNVYDDPLDMGTNGWRMSVMDVGTYGIRYDLRSHLAAADFGLPLPRDMLRAVLLVDAEGKFLDAEQNYVLRFAPGQAPPVAAFWSLTLYTAGKRLHGNTAAQCALTSGSRLAAEADGSIVIYLQQKKPGRKQQANWLPTPALGYFFLVLRLYDPEQIVLNADWHLPKIMPGKSKTTRDAPDQPAE